MPKKKFKETKFGQFLSKAVKAVPDLAEAAVDVASGDFQGAVGNVREALNLEAKKPDAAEKIDRLRMQFERMYNEFELEMYQLEVQDRDSARSREVEIAKTGKSDWMMYLTGILVLAATIVMMYFIFTMEIPNKEIAYLLIGQISGMASAVVFYYYGTSKSSNDKTRMLSSKQ